MSAKAGTNGRTVKDKNGRNVALIYRTPKHGAGTLLVGNPGPRRNFAAELKGRIAAILDEPAAWAEWADIIRHPKQHPRMAAHLLDHTIGRPRQAVELTGKDGGPLEYKQVKDELADRITQGIAGATTGKSGGR
jgi:hypothetical protein